MKRIYWESMKKWAVRTGIVGVSGFALLFMYLSFLGVIEVTGYSGDVICEGTINDPCLAYINFTAKEDIFLYPLGYDPWGRDTPFSTDIELESWKMYRSWGTGWREIKLDQTCTGTWCGAPNSDGVAYSFVFREDRDYQIKIEALKKNPDDIIKWGFGPVDPVWYSDSPELNKLEYFEENKKVSIKNVLDENLADLEITSHPDLSKPIFVGIGWQEGFVIKGNNKLNYSDAIGNVEIIDVETGEIVIRDYFWQKAIYGDVEIDDYVNVCEIIYSINGSNENCEQVLIGTHIENKIIDWKNMTGDLEAGDFTIRLMVWVNVGDYKDGVAVLFGKKIDKWATWTNDLTNGIKAYWQFNETTGTNVPEYFNGTHNLVVGGNDWKIGKIGEGYFPNPATSVNSTFDLSTTTEVTYNFWVNVTANLADNGILIGVYAGTANNPRTYLFGGFENPRIQAAAVIEGDELPDDGSTWNMITFTFNETDEVIYQNGTETARTSGLSRGGFSSNSIYLMDRKAGGVPLTNTVLDEFGVWFRVLTQSEITQLYNDGAGITPPSPSLPPSINYSVALPLNLIRFLDCGPDITNPHSQPDGQTSVIAAINATNNGTGTGDFTINLTGTLNTGWTIRASNDTFANNITLSTTAQTIWSSVGVDETKKIWLAATCNNVVINPGESIDMQAV